MINNLKQKEIDKIIIILLYEAKKNGWVITMIDNNIFELKKKK